MQIDSKKVIVITGASRGVGKAMAIRLSPFRSHLVLVARRREALEITAIHCRENGADARIIVADMGIPEDVKRIAHEASLITGEINVWINNAGVLAAGALEDVPDEINEHVLRTNLLGYIRGAQAVLPFFKQQSKGILINNISIGGWLPAPYATAYTASKFGLRGFSAALKGELAHYPEIHIVDLVPGFIDTPGIDHAANYMGKEIKAIPPVGDPQKVADAVVSAISHPRSIMRVGIPARILQITYGLFPKITRTIAGAIIRRYLKNARPTDTTPGNVLNPLEFGSGIYGGPASHPGKISENTKLIIAAGLILMVTARAFQK